MKTITTLAAIAALTTLSACSDQVTEPAPIDVGSNPADRDHSEQREQNQQAPEAPVTEVVEAPAEEKTSGPCGDGTVLGENEKCK